MLKSWGQGGGGWGWLVVDGLQDFSVSPSPPLGLFGLELGWTGLGLGFGGLGTKGLGTRARQYFFSIFPLWKHRIILSTNSSYS